MASPTILRRDTGPAPALTTTFVPPPQCTQGHLTMLARQAFYVWLNEPLPVAATTVGDCYPQQFMASYLDSYHGTTRPAFSPLVCPQSYQTISRWNLGGDSPYIVCCPNNYGFAPPGAPDPDRPAFGGTCYSNIISTTVTKYNQNALSGPIFFSTSGQAYAHPYDGFAYQGHAGPTAPAGVVVQPSQTTAVSPAGSTKVDSGTNANPVSGSESGSGSGSGQDSLAASTQALPSVLAVSTISSSVVALTTLSSSVVVYSTLQPSVITLYNSIPSSSTQSTASAAAITTQTPSTALTGGQIAGIAIGIIAGITILLAAAFFLLARRRRQRNNQPLDIPTPSTAQLDDTNVPYSLVYPLEKAKIITEHPSTRSYPNEKERYTLDEHAASYSPREYHELVSPSHGMEQPHPERFELGSGLRGSLAQANDTDLRSTGPASTVDTTAAGSRRTDIDWSTTTPVSTFSPNKP